MVEHLPNALIAFNGSGVYYSMIAPGRCAYGFPSRSGRPVDALEAARSVAAEVAPLLAVELIEVRLTGSGHSDALRVIVDQDGGVSAETCADFSRRFDLLWEGRQAERRDFSLEVTSPGPNRALTAERDFARIIGRWVEIAYATESACRTVIGRVASCDGGRLHLTEVDGGTEETQISLGSIERAKVLFLIGSPRPKRAKKSLRRSKRR